MSKIFKVLYGDFKFRKKIDYITVPLKVLYIIYSIPFLLFAVLLMLRSFGAFGSSTDEKFGLVKKILFHFADIFWSFIFWGIIVNLIYGNY